MCLKWHITTTEITKRNTVNKEILINKKKAHSHIKKVCLFKKIFSFEEKKVCSHRKKVCLYTQTSHGK